MAMDWDRLASSYGRQLWLERSAIELLLELLEPRTDERLLDLGTGPGVTLSSLAGRPAPPRVAVGVDSSETMLGAAPALPAGWSLVHGDATALPFADDSFDLITSSYLLHILGPETRRAAIAECSRVLRPGGRIGTITVAPPQSRLGRLATAPVRAASERSDGRWRGLRPHDPAPELEAAGFSELARRRSFLGYPSLCLLARLGEGLPT